LMKKCRLCLSLNVVLISFSIHYFPSHPDNPCSLS
jgi:hypothetical protein